MNWNSIVTVYAKELKDSLRDRRTLMSMIIIPTFVMPALMFGVGKIAMTVVSKARSEIPAVMVLGGEDSPGVVAALGASKKVTLVPAAADWKQQISDKKIRAAVRLPEKFERDLAAGAAGAVVIYHYEGELKSGFAAGELEKYFRTLREQTVASQLTRRGLPATLIQPFDTKRPRHSNPQYFITVFAAASLLE